MKTSFAPIVVISALFSLVACDGRTLIGSQDEFEIHTDAGPAVDASAPSDTFVDVGKKDTAQLTDAGDASGPPDGGPSAEVGSPQMCNNISSACGVTCCGPTQACVQGSCLNSCPAELPNMCKQRCTNFDVDPWNCGDCGTVCRQKYECVAGTCLPIN